VRHHEIKVALRLSVPALGYHTLTVRAGHEGEFTRHPGAHGLATSERSMENEYLKVEVKGNGALKLTDKRTGQVYRRLLTFEDIADIGDGWFHGAAVNDQAFVSTACHAQVALVHDSPLLTTFRVRTTMPVPARFDFGRMRRVDQFVDLVIDSMVTLRHGRAFVEVKTTVDNSAEDHRLRVLLPSGVRTVTYLADSAFDVVERPIPVREDNHMYRELEVETKPQQSWTAVFDDERGLAVVGDGLLETAVRDLPERPIALTLFRATGRTVGTTGEPEGQLPGMLTFDYWLVPLAGDPDRTHLCELGQKISAGLKVAQLGPRDIPIHRSGDFDLPRRAGFLRLDGSAVLTSLRRVDGALEARVFNPLKATTAVTLSLGDWPAGDERPSQAQRVDMESTPLGEPWTIDGEVSIRLKPKEIVTLRLE
jgi:alpha-mannosidase/mannosylglycerate hydrolase